MINNNLLSIVILLFILSTSCYENLIPPENIFQAENFLHIAHTRTDSNPNMDSIVENIDYSKFEMLLLGGDLAYLTSQDDKTIAHVDSILSLGDPNTLWSLGNHDYTDLERVQKFTNRPPYYSYHNNGITFIVLDTQDSLSNIIGNQKEMLNSVLDTISESSHLIILHHKLIWMYGNSILEPQISSISNGELGDCFYCINPNNFYYDIYPNLIEVRQKGIEVLCIGGDIGFKSKVFEYETDEGIHFLASGIKSGDKDNNGIIFHHDVTNKNLSWEFKQLSDL